MFLSSISPGGYRGLAAVVLLAAAAAVQAQAAADRSPRPDPLDAQARVPAVGHVSSLAGYRPLGDEARVSWKDANETVNRIGGWRAYARQAQPAAPGSSAPKPAPAQGHHGAP
jgi:hypothetical protein